MTMARKVFGIGLSRTGTTSLTRALAVVGYRGRHYPNPTPLLAGDFSVADRFDALTDLPVAVFFREFDRLYPGSRFILTVREAESWARSVREHFGAMGPTMEGGAEGEIRRRAYGRSTFDAEEFLRARESHHRAVREHFAGRPGDLLEMDITAGQGWEVLCPFLGVPIPTEPFPALNARGTHPMPRRPVMPEARTWIVGPGLPGP